MSYRDVEQNASLTQEYVQSLADAASGSPHQISAATVQHSSIMESRSMEIGDYHY